MSTKLICALSIIVMALALVAAISSVVLGCVETPDYVTALGTAVWVEPEARGVYWTSRMGMDEMEGQVVTLAPKVLAPYLASIGRTPPSVADMTDLFAALAVRWRASPLTRHEYPLMPVSKCGGDTAAGLYQYREIIAWAMGEGDAPRALYVHELGHHFDSCWLGREADPLNERTEYWAAWGEVLRRMREAERGSSRPTGR
jgi:hypothetical protein